MSKSYDTYPNTSRLTYTYSCNDCQDTFRENYYSTGIECGSCGSDRVTLVDVS